LLPLHLEGAVPDLDRLLEAPDGLALLLEGQLLARARDAEHHQLALDLGELDVPVLQQHLRRLASDALPLQGRSSVGKSGLLLLEPPLSPWRAVRSCRSWSLVAASAATLASRAALKSSASLAFCSSARTRSSA
jgi:hypothetical protein